MPKPNPTRDPQRAKPTPHAKPPQPASTQASDIEKAAAAAAEAEGQQRLRVQRMQDLIGSMLSLLGGFTQGDQEMALSALATVVGQVMAATQHPPNALGFVVRVAQQTSSAIIEHHRRAAAEAAKQPA